MIYFEALSPGAVIFRFFPREVFVCIFGTLMEASAVDVRTWEQDTLTALLRHPSLGVRYVECCKLGTKRPSDHRPTSRPLKLVTATQAFARVAGRDCTCGKAFSMRVRDASDDLERSDSDAKDVGAQIADALKALFADALMSHERGAQLHCSLIVDPCLQTAGRRVRFADQKHTTISREAKDCDSPRAVFFHNRYHLHCWLLGHLTPYYTPRRSPIATT
jgi:hypothetical protein